MKTELLYLHFSVCHVVSWLVVPPFSVANSLISADVLATAHYNDTKTRCWPLQVNVTKTCLVKLFLIYVAANIDLKLKTFFSVRRINCKKTKNDIKKLGLVT